MDIASFFSPSIFGNLVATILPFVFFLFFFLPFLAMPLPQLVSILGAPPSMHFGHEQDKNFGNLITEIQFSVFPDTLYFFLQFQQHRCRISASLLILPNNLE